MKDEVEGLVDQCEAFASQARTDTWWEDEAVQTSPVGRAYRADLADHLDACRAALSRLSEENERLRARFIEHCLCVEDALTAARDQARMEERERCARVAESFKRALWANNIAAAIRKGD